MKETFNTLFKDVVWWQKWEIAPGVYTPGHNPVDHILSSVNLPRDLSGKRVLDIGSWNGCFSFECERRGADVLAVGPESPVDTGFLKLKEFLNSRVEYRHGSVYYLRPEQIGYFDIVLCFGVFYHLRYPLLGLDNIRLICREGLYLETLIMENSVYNSKKNSFSRLKDLNRDLEDIPLLQFYRKNEICDDDSNWFGPNNEAMLQMLKSSGFTPTHVSLSEQRGHYKCTVDTGMPEFLTIKCGENVYYDRLMKDILGSREGFQK